TRGVGEPAVNGGFAVYGAGDVRNSASVGLRGAFPLGGIWSRRRAEAPKPARRVIHRREVDSVRVMRAVCIGVLAVLMTGGAAQATTPDELSTTSRLQDRREVAAGTRAYSIGFEDGRFYANGWHITGEMGGVWTPPL